MPGLIVWWLLLCWTFTTSWPRPFDDWKNCLFYVGSGLLTGYLLWQQRRSFTLARNSFTLLVMFYGAWAVLSLTTPWSASYEGALALARLILWCGLAWSLSHLSNHQWRLLSMYSVLSAVLMAVFTWLGIHGHWSWPYTGSFMCPIGHVSYYSDFMVLNFPLAAYLLLHTTDKRLKAVWIIAHCFILLGLWCSGTRASFVALLGGISCALVLCCYRLRRIPWRPLSLVVLVLLVIFFSFHWLEPRSVRGTSLTGRMLAIFSTHSDRWDIALQLLPIIKVHPLMGWGLGGFRFVYPEYVPAAGRAATWLMHPHNELLNQAMELGLPGLLLFCGLMGMFFRYGLRTLKTTPSGEEATTIIIALCGVVIAILSWQLSTNFLFPLSRLLTAGYAALLWRAIAPLCPSPPKVLHPRWTALLMIPVLVSWLLLGAYDVSLYAVNQNRRAGTAEEAQKWARIAYILAPGAFDPLFNYAATCLRTHHLPEAVPAIERLHSSYPSVPAVLHLTAITRFQMGRLPEAKEMEEHALRIDPELPASRALLQEIDRRR